MTFCKNSHWYNIWINKICINKILHSNTIKNCTNKKKQWQLFNDQKFQLINKFKYNFFCCFNYKKNQYYEKNNQHYKSKFSNINVWNEILNKHNDQISISRLLTNLRKYLKSLIFTDFKNKKFAINFITSTMIFVFTVVFVLKVFQFSSNFLNMMDLFMLKKIEELKNQKKNIIY